MQLLIKHRRIFVIWLSAILLLLSVTASAHSVSHLDEGANTHCTLCFHQHQLNKVLPQHSVNFIATSQRYERIVAEYPPLPYTHFTAYQSRAPPVTL